MIHHLSHDIGWPVLALGVLIVLGSWRPVLAWARFEIELARRARRIHARGGFIEISPARRKW